MRPAAATAAAGPGTADRSARLAYFSTASAAA